MNDELPKQEEQQVTPRRAKKLAHILRGVLTFSAKAGLGVLTVIGADKAYNQVINEPPQVPAPRLHEAFDEAKASLRYQLPDDACIPIRSSVDDDADGDHANKRKFTVNGKSFYYSPEWAGVADATRRAASNNVRVCDVGEHIVFVDFGFDTFKDGFKSTDFREGDAGKLPVWLGDRTFYPNDGRVMNTGELKPDFRLVVVPNQDSFDKLFGENGSFVIREEELAQLAEKHIGISVKSISPPTQVGQELWAIVQPEDSSIPPLFLLRISFGWNNRPNLSYHWAGTQDELQRALTDQYVSELPTAFVTIGSQIDEREQVASKSGTGWVSTIDGVISSFFLDETDQEKWENLRNSFRDEEFPSVRSVHEESRKVTLFNTVLTVVMDGSSDPTSPEPTTRSFVLNKFFNKDRYVFSAQYVEGDTGDKVMTFVTTSTEAGIVVFDKNSDRQYKIKLTLDDYLNSGIQFKCTFENNRLLIQGFKGGEKVVELQSSKVFGENGDLIGVLGLHLVE